jgi:hypothetical protein
MKRNWKHLHTFRGSQRLWSDGPRYYLADESGDDDRRRRRLGRPDETDDGPLRIADNALIEIGGADGRSWASVPVICERDGTRSYVPMRVQYAIVLASMVPDLRLSCAGYEWRLSLVDRTHLAPTRGEATACGLMPRFRHTPTMTAEILDVTCPACIAAHGASLEGQGDDR